MAGTQQAAAVAAETAAGASPSSWWRRLAAGLGADGGERRRRRAVALALYEAIVERARDPFLFAGLGVPDTREGRLEAVMLHAILVMRRLQAGGDAGRRALAQELFDLMFADIDQHMREWGVGDLSVGKHVKKVAQTFYARAAALEPALAEGDPAALVPVLARNVYGVEPAGAPPPPGAAGLARHLVEQAERLRRQPDAELLGGRPGLGPLTAAASGGRD